jgi:hypothetical protein
MIMKSNQRSLADDPLKKSNLHISSMSLPSLLQHLVIQGEAVMEISNTSKMLCGIILITVPTIEYGGSFLLGMRRHGRARAHVIARRAAALSKDRYRFRSSMLRQSIRAFWPYAPLSGEKN